MTANENGIHICEKCGKEFKWVCTTQNRKNLSAPGLADVFEIPTDARLVRSRREMGRKIQYDVHCFYCDYENIFEVDI